MEFITEGEMKMNKKDLIENKDIEDNEEFKIKN